MMLELATQLTDWERDRIRLDFALFVAKRARRYHVDPEQIIDITKSQSAVRSPRSSDGREPSPAGVEGDIDRRHIQIGARHSAEGEVANVAASPAIQPETATGSTAAEKRRSLRDRVIAMHRMHPTWTARLIANELGAPLSSVSVYLAGARRIVAGEKAEGRVEA